MYISKRTNTKLIISDLPSSHKHWKGHYFFVGCRNWEYNPAGLEDTLGIPTIWTTLKNLRELPFALIGLGLRESGGISNFALVVWPSGIRPSLSSEDEEVKQQLAKCLQRVYSELIPEPSGVKPLRSLVLRSSLPSVMKPSREGPSVMKPTREELQVRVESLAKKKRSARRKPQAPPESSLAIRDKIQRLGASSLSSTTKERGSSNQVQ